MVRASSVDASRNDIWRYVACYRPDVPAEHRLTHGEGWTPAVEMPALAPVLGLDRLVVKREDLNPFGSHKARGIAFQISAALAEKPGLRWFVIPSSGNAAVAAAGYAALAGARVAGFLSERTAEAKREAFVRLGGLALIAERPIALADEVAAALGVPNLRPSTHPLAPEGFQSLAWELLETVAPVDALFSFVSSGASFEGIGRAFERGAEVVARPWRPQLHVVQAAGVGEIAAIYDSARAVGAPALRLGALGARRSRRTATVRRMVRSTCGHGWAVDDADAVAAQGLLATVGIETSLEGAASLAAAGRAASERGVRSAIVILTGRPAGDFPSAAAAGSGAEHAVSDVDEAIARIRDLGDSEVECRPAQVGQGPT